MTRILIVDDGPFIRQLIKDVVTNASGREYEIVGEAENGQEALEKYRQLKPDLMTLDITMPVMDGLEALRRIMEYDVEARVVMVSAIGQEAIIKEAIKRGARSFVLKPFTADVLCKVLENAIKI
ncbi:MAG: response regulator [Lachnospiraceae bacterium]